MHTLNILKKLDYKFGYSVENKIFSYSDDNLEIPRFNCNFFSHGKFSKSKILAIIPASGSVGIKNKNISKIGNTTLLEKAINDYKKINFIDDIIISTDSRSIAKIAEKNNL